MYGVNLLDISIHASYYYYLTDPIYVIIAPPDAELSLFGFSNLSTY